MHDAAAESANFTECVPAPPGEGCGSAATEGGWTTSQPITLQRRSQGRRRLLRWEETLRTLTLIATIGMSDLDGV